ncbi:hypothetical protein [Leptospira kirschneri]|uniref:Uncharacterized protein n=1 Tax=Leptospira kirschneri str. H1 TaxID=1049966 RepID=A0A0E2AY18_9LEPT|nr:hypothetical protein [Leptospira kirschneri]EKO13815.1 hypothetical protein LEP1GSC081_3111 [Leptospira kirschneri str. H1]
MKVGITKKTESTAFAERSKSKFRDVGSTDRADSGLTSSVFRAWMSFRSQ